MWLRISFLVSFFVVVCPAMGQALQKKVLTPEDYSVWHTLDIGEVSHDGKWVSYSCRYNNGLDTLSVNKVGTPVKFAIANGREGKFGEAFFACLLPDNVVAVLNLKTGRQHLVSNASGYEIVRDGKYMLIPQKRDTSHYYILSIRDHKGNSIDSIANVLEHTISANNKSMLYTCFDKEKYRINKYDFYNGKSTEIYFGADPIHGLTCSPDGNLYAFYRQGATGNSINLFEAEGKNRMSIPLGKDSNITGKLRIGVDGDKVFFYISDNNAVSEPVPTELPEVWHTSDSIIYPFRNTVSNMKRLAVGLPSEKRYEMVNSGWLSEFSLSGTQRYAVLRPYARYGQDGRLFDITDVYVKSLHSGRLVKVLEDYTGDPNMLKLSPVGDKMTYYLKGSWWCYDMDSDVHTKLAAGLNVQWDNTGDATAIQLEVYGNPAWSDDGRFLLLYDRYDIWKVATDGSKAERLTKGREKGIAFRIEYAALHFNQDHFQYAPSQAAMVSLSKPIVVSARGQDNRNGLFILERDKGEQPLHYGFSTIDQVRINKGKYTYRQQSFEQPPVILCRDAENGKEKVVVSSNPQQQGYQWGKAECIYYRGPKGENLKAALLYPAGFEPGKKYPMVVNIYQSLSQWMNRYVLPSQANESGFNATNYTLDGYLVLLPDIAYALGDPGPSVIACVEAAVQKAIDMGVADSAKVGLIGHSFGGYEVNYILTGSVMFAAGVSGAGISDSTGWYFSSSATFGGTEAWRYEQQQYRMGVSFYQNKEGYFRNSPIFNADAIHTPMLLWAGKEDSTVPFGQSMAMYHALRRLKKDCTMLLYPDEGHNLTGKKNQVDLSNKIKQWFDHYLKGRPAGMWMENKL